MSGPPGDGSRRFALLGNPAAAGGRAMAHVPEITAELDRLGAEHRVVETRSADQAREEAIRAAEQGETLLALGGDGLVGLLAGVMKDRPSALGILPAGRGNDFARVLGIPREPRDAAVTAVRGEERLVDVAAVNGKPFVGIASLGFDSDANRIANEARLVRGNGVYLYAALRALAGWRHATFRLRVDGEPHEVRGFCVAVANSKAYGGGMFIAPHAKLDDGRLEVMMIDAASKLTFLRDLPKVFSGAAAENPYVRWTHGSTIEIEADRPFEVYADGDPIGRVPVTVTIAPRCLRVIVPADAEAA